MDRREKPKRRTRKSKGKMIGRKLMTLILGSLIFYLAFNFGQGFYQIHQLKKELSALEQEYTELQEINNELLNEVEYLHSPEAIEKIAREKLGLIKEGEIVIMRAREAD
ncbi:MAG: septum formation initiator family protein [Clostridia bacterium]|jgi:cell division protein FtsL|nr:septum formation initiator family protein [Clostridia bacterium]